MVEIPTEVLKFDSIVCSPSNVNQANKMPKSRLAPLSTFSYAGPPVVPFLTPFLGEGSPTKIDYRKKGTVILISLLEDLGYAGVLSLQINPKNSSSTLPTQ